MSGGTGDLLSNQVENVIAAHDKVAQGAALIMQGHNTITSRHSYFVETIQRLKLELATLEEKSKSELSALKFDLETKLAKAEAELDRAKDKLNKAFNTLNG